MVCHKLTGKKRGRKKRSERHTWAQASPCQSAGINQGGKLQAGVVVAAAAGH